jgi:hypothetical protein
VVAIALSISIAVGCGGQPRDLGMVNAHDPEFDMDGQWVLVEIEGATLAAGPVPAVAVEVAADGTTATVLFRGGDPNCYTVADVRVERHDPKPPMATVMYGMRLGVTGCNAALANLAIRVPLDPPFEPGG